MASYLVRIEGRGIDFVATDRLASWLGFLGFGRKVRCVGFFATRRIEADTLEAGVDAAKRGIVEELLKTKVILGNRVAELELRVDEAVEESAMIQGDQPKGFSFYQQR